MNAQPEVKRERGRGRLYHQRGSAFWWMAFYKHGKQIRMSTEETDEKKAERALKLKLQERDAELGGGKKMITPQQQRITVSELLDNLETDYRLRGKCSPQFKSHLAHIRNHFGEWRAIEVTAAFVDTYIEGRKAAGAKPASINRSTQVFGQAFKLAVERGQLTSAPKLRHLPERNARQGFFSGMEFHSVLSNLPEYLRDFTRFGYLTGWRSGEIKSLSWSDLDGDTIKLRAENSKNGRARTVPLVGELAELLERRRLQMTQKTKLIFHRDGLPVGDYRKAWATACVMAGVGAMACPKCAGVVEALPRCAECSKQRCGECSKLRCIECSLRWKSDELKYTGKLFHDLRRSFCRDAIRAGVSQTVAMSVSGHITDSVFRRYDISDDADQRQALLNRQSYSARTMEQRQEAVPNITTERIQ
jgi:integrase